MRWLALALALACLAPTGEARACGGLVTTASFGNPTIDAQRAIVVWREETVDIHVQLAASGIDAPAWLIPVPSVPEVGLGDADAFTALEQLTKPTVLLQRSRGGGSGGCMSDSGSDGGETLNLDGVTVFDSGVLGDIEYEVVKAHEVEDLTAWLAERDYPVTKALEVALSEYVEADMAFVAARLTAEGDAAELPALTLTVPRPGSARLLYPLGLGRISAGDIVPVLIWVIADKRYRVASYASGDLALVANELRAMEDRGQTADYNVALDTLTKSAGGQLMITEYANETTLSGTLAGLGDTDDVYVTRLFGRVPADSLVDVELAFTKDAPPVAPTITVEAPNRTPYRALPIIGVLLLLLGVSARRPTRRTGRRG